MTSCRYRASGCAGGWGWHSERNHAAMGVQVGQQRKGYDRTGCGGWIAAGGSPAHIWEKGSIEMFKAGDKALRVSDAQWSGARSYSVVTVGKVHKTGRLTLVGSKAQWRYQRGYGDNDPGHFVPTDKWRREALYLDTPELRNEIDGEIQVRENRLKLNRIGDALARIRDNEAASKLFENLPVEFHDLIKPSRGAR